MNIENKVNNLLASHPKIKELVKRIYQRCMYLISKKVKYEGEIQRVSPNDEFEYFFGYYDKSPWDITGRYMICLKTKDTSRNVAPEEKAEILLIDTLENNKTIEVAQTKAWNVQQGCMAQWLGPDFKNKIIYNDFRNGKFCSVILDVFTNEEKEICMPVYSVASNGKFALSLDFSRLHSLRPGYGYSNIKDKTEKIDVPQGPCIWYIDLERNTSKGILNYDDLLCFENREEMKNSKHKVNHIMLNPGNSRFMVIHRWLNGNKKYSRLLTCDIDGNNLFNLSDDDMVSHCYWKNDEEIIAYERKKNYGDGFYLMKDKTNEYTRLWKHIMRDGHPSYSPDNSLVVTDTYANKKRMCTVKVMNEDEIITVANVFEPFKYDNDTRCDLHPRWSRDGKKICIDAVFEGKRRLYVIPLDKINFTNHSELARNIKNKSKENKIKIVYLMTACKRKGPIEQTLNIIKNLDTEKFYPILITIYEEDKNSRLNEYIPFVNEHYYINTSKKSILLRKTKPLDNLLMEIKPDIVHTLGLFPDLYVSNLNKYSQITTLRNYVYEDYPKKFGKFKGLVMAKLHLKAIKNITKVLTCSKSLSKIYQKKLHLNFEYIQNGVDITKYNVITKERKYEIRKELGLKNNDLVYIYTGQFIERKNISFLLECFCEKYKNNSNVKILLLGNGSLLEGLKQQYRNESNIIFYGSVNNVSYYLNASDIYISTSKSEGLPNGVLEALATGLPFILSDIPQHMELYEANSSIGYIYKQDIKNDLIDCFSKAEKDNLDELSINARKTAEDNFSSQSMSKKYQEMYIRLIN